MSTIQNDIDLLMSLDPLNYSDSDIDVIIAYHRNHRAAREAGAKGSRAKKDTGPKQTIDLASLGLKPAAPTVKRRI